MPATLNSPLVEPLGSVSRRLRRLQLCSVQSSRTGSIAPRLAPVTGTAGAPSVPDQVLDVVRLPSRAYVATAVAGVDASNAPAAVAARSILRTFTALPYWG